MCFLNCFFDFREVFLILFESRHPSLNLEQFGGTPIYNILLNICQAQKLAALQKLSTTPKGSEAPGLRITALGGNLEFQIGGFFFDKT